MVEPKDSEPETAAEVDFSKGVRGKYAKRFAEGTNIVILAESPTDLNPLD